MKSNILEYIGIDPAYILIGMIGVIILLLIILIVAMSKISKLKKQYNFFMAGENGQSLQDSFEKRFSELDNLTGEITTQGNELKEMKEFLSVTFSKVGIVKYDAFKEMGGNMSFALALLNDKNDGFLINSMHNREGCYTYIKEIIKGESFIVLAEEEKEALDNAINIRNYMQ